jgi:hypothetical protein
MDQHLHPIPADLADEAESLWQANAGVYKGSLTAGEGLRAGLIGEVLVMEQLRRHGLPVERTGGPDNDLLVLGRRVEVKTTRQAGTRVRPSYNAHVEDRSHRGLRQQECDAYVFCRVDYDHLYGAILGWDLPFNITGRKGRWVLQKAGTEIMGSGKPAPADNWVLPVSRLPSITLLPDYIRHWHKSAA